MLISAPGNSSEVSWNVVQLPINHICFANIIRLATNDIGRFEHILFFKKIKSSNMGL